MFRGDFRKKKVCKKRVKKGFFSLFSPEMGNFSQKHVKITIIVLNPVLAASWRMATNLRIKG